jgi:uncharacterized protein YukE
MSWQDSAGLADPAALEDAARRLGTEAITHRAQVLDWVRRVGAAQWTGAAASSFKEEQQREWFISSGLAQQLEHMASLLRDGASAVRTEIDRRRREREAREAADQRRKEEAAKKKEAAASAAGS